MNRGKWIICRNGNDRGFTLIELLAVIVVLGIVMSIAVLSYSSIIEKSEKDVCHLNRVTVEKDYRQYLTLEGEDTSEVLFAEFLRQYDRDLCPGRGEFVYEEGAVICSVHSEVVPEEDGDVGDGVPYL
ncbi:type II secretion system protein [Falsibacillus pallidus]|uniref:Prepilin-type N-terminal cleavage/methylation domain-containing protein n=1 Tax=Falsibacillus pallidus TaxID=493781 RepID=A0A370GEG6_9BACI|nr:type II secretion system protein [Falsibacillus pallidus]RDI41650.1 prepilin-type N-terminal cleavage/methylation domain-containing protein [Falsibacillus pallidus]